MKPRAIAFVAVADLLLAIVAGAAAQGPAGQATLIQVATFEHQVTGVAVGRNGRIFVNFPRWTEDSAVSVAELMRDGTLKPFPDARWNAWRNTKKNELSPGDYFVCVQSVVADRQGNLWALDPAAPAAERIVPGGPKLVKIDLASNRVAKVVHFDETVAPLGSYLNDVRFSPDGRFAYITDAGARGAIVVVTLPDGTARRTLDGHPSTQPEKTVVVKTDGRELRRPDGRGVEFAADGIALSPDGRYLYWQALTGRTLYRIPTEALQNAATPAAQIARRVERVGETDVADGLWMDQRGRLYISALEEDAVKIRDGDRVTTLVQDKRLRWPDSFAEGPDGAIYVTASHIQDMAWFRPDAAPQVRTELFRIEAQR